MSTPSPVPDRLTLSIEEAAHVLGIGRGLAYELARTGQLPVLRLGRRIVVPRAQLETMLASEASAGAVTGSQEPRVADAVAE